MDECCAAICKRNGTAWTISDSTWNLLEHSSKSRCGLFGRTIGARWIFVQTIRSVKRELRRSPPGTVLAKFASSNYFRWIGFFSPGSKRRKHTFGGTALAITHVGRAIPTSVGTQADCCAVRRCRPDSLLRAGMATARRGKSRLPLQARDDEESDLWHSGVGHEKKHLQTPPCAGHTRPMLHITGATT